MKIKSYPEIMRPAFRFIEKHAPNTFEAMLNAYWPVTAVKDMDELLPLAKLISRSDFHQIAHTLAGANAVTAESSVFPELKDRIPQVVDHNSWFNLPCLLKTARREHVDPTKLLATVAVHEWKHRRGYDEGPAYDAGVKFAREMGELRIARWHEQLGRDEQETNREDNLIRDMLREWGIKV